MTLHRFAVLLLVLLTGTCPVLAQQAPVETPQPPPAAASAPPPPTASQAPTLPTGEAERLLRLLQDDARRADLVKTLEGLAAAARAQPGATPAGTAAPAETAAGASPAQAQTQDGGQAQPGQPAAGQPPEAEEPSLLAPNTLGAQLLVGASQRLSDFSDQAVAAVQAVTDLPAIAAWANGVVRDPVTQRRVLDAAWKLLLAFGLGLVAEWIAWRALRRPRDALDALAPANGSVWNWLQRLPLVAGRLLLDLVPLVAFAVVSYGLVRAVDPLPTTQLIMLTVNNAYMASRIVMLGSRMLLSPASAPLRLVPVSDETAAYITVWLRRITLVLVFGYATAEAGLLLGLPWGGYDAILRGCLLVVTLFLIIVILQNRHTIAEVLRAPPVPEGEHPERARRLLRGLRNRLAEVWHLIAMLWLVALWGVWALEIDDGFERLLRVSGVTLLIAALAKLVDTLLRHAIERGFRISHELNRRYPGLEARANRYLPVLQGIVSGIIAAIAFLFLLEAWGVDAFDWFSRGKLGNRLLSSLVSIGLTVLIAVGVWEAANAAIQRRLARLAHDTKAARSARVRTLLPMLRTALMVVILTFVVLNALSEIGVNVAPLLAGAGVIGVAIGFGSQKLVQDVITGVFLLFEDAMAVGDVVQLGGLSGVVEQLSIRSIKLRSLDGSVHIIPFSAVTTVTNMTRDFSFALLDVRVAYGEDTDRVVEVLREITAELRNDPRLGPVIRDDLDVLGVESLGEAGSGVVIRCRIKTEPIERWNVMREMNRRIKQRFDQLGIEIPYPHQKIVVSRPGERHPAESPEAATKLAAQ